MRTSVYVAYDHRAHMGVGFSSEDALADYQAKHGYFYVPAITRKLIEIDVPRARTIARLGHQDVTYNDLLTESD